MSAEDVRVADGALWVGRRAIPLAQVRCAAAEQRRPSILWPAGLAVVAGVFALPTTIVLLASDRIHALEGVLHGALLGAVAVFFASVWRILTVEDEYCVVLETSSGPRTALVSRDPQLVVSLVARLNDDIGAAVRVVPSPPLAAEVHG